MVWVIRVGAYLFSGLTIWQFMQNNTAGIGPLHRPLAIDQAHAMILGVCAGVSNYTGLDVSIIRLVWVLAGLYRGAGIILYILAFFIMPLAS